ncbi:siphovirus ReqiPepy6 Gp37-like family protein [Clostridium botulinum]|uniref:siphovirus ReqiPepy6 Gp37-like family protein n=1 Tax=Clostridium botulinum TaxID=1491 RepID=UPI00059B9B86|nr:siphovirus ReqiPepy6 Gp37-like family protein [Clostridium botulinum]KIN79893.1 hypothetical protein SD74_18270 [Clostridium botulinum]MCC5425845.1 siphovirus ReqiPepy6 Gp37-like family protein [Clostridium botulinum]HCL4578799.1 siphovirus ReqiPepy6 Gp37-like family protein [Clostridium botulinum]HDI4925350.1 siphovirus ReqiPepy6 Gp37-like family protein [Clostridium botulinum]HDK7182943.1 siphovirus ReqiPepy6 Gp37-like family protein [Clostridium botulinum]
MIRIFDKNLNFLGEIDNYENLIYTRRFSKIGGFELHINMNKNHTDKLQDSNIIMINNNPNKCGIIMHRENLQDEGNSSETLVIKGLTLNGLLNKRVIIPVVGEAYSISIGTIESIMKDFVNKNAVNPVDKDRIIENLIIAKNKNRGKQDKWRAKYNENLSDKLTEIGEYGNLGYEVLFDYHERKLIFDVIEGRNLTDGQEILPPVIFSTKYDNLNKKHFIESTLNYKNVAYCGGKGLDEDRLIQQVGNAKGIDRVETYFECSNLETIEDLKTEGKQKLEDYNKIYSFETGINPFKPFKYGEDYDLGDIVTLQDKKMGITMNARIVEIKEIYGDMFNIEIIFGTNIPNFLDNIRKEIKRVVR